MGSSGCGKTSLLNMLSDRISVGRGDTKSGSIRLNDAEDFNNLVFGKIGAYVMQDDILFSYFSPREALRFAARLKLTIPFADQDNRVESLLQELGLLNVANTLIGSATKKLLSGGERKRAAIGVALITDPSLILLDEPTSGLDSFKALSIVMLLKSLSRKGKTLITTIH
jgi:ABC-type multidrug transport system ATPase subunit